MSILDSLVLRLEWYDKVQRPLTRTQPTLRLGRLDIATVGYDWTSLVKRGERHRAYVYLPGVAVGQGGFDSIDAAKTRVEEVVAYYIGSLAPVARVRRPVRAVNTPEIPRVRRSR